MNSRHARFATPASPDSVAVARDQVLVQVTSWGLALEKDTREAIKLVASELITNAVVHTDGLISIGLYLSEDRLLLVVHDSSQTLPTPPARCNPAEVESGRGLLLVTALADRWGSGLTSGGKTVWAEFDVPPQPPAVASDTLPRRAPAARSCAGLRIAPEGVVLAGAMR
ncbi:ATP-binding protein [Streptomyces sp. NPDC059070]|uniref:ATP-binding protein n=1 Tax=Streptomyces sp. NPDC059070 TaxID=3346713 RepID=UPI0036AA1DCA